MVLGRELNVGRDDEKDAVADALHLPEWDHGGTYWDNPEGHEKHNPARFVSQWKTPMLVVQGEQDYRVPVSTADPRQGRLFPIQVEEHG